MAKRLFPVVHYRSPNSTTTVCGKLFSRTRLMTAIRGAVTCKRCLDRLETGSPGSVEDLAALTNHLDGGMPTQESVVFRQRRAVRIRILALPGTGPNELSKRPWV